MARLLRRSVVAALARLVRRLAGSDSPVHCVVFGDPPEIRAYRQLIDALARADRGIEVSSSRRAIAPTCSNRETRPLFARAER